MMKKYLLILLAALALAGPARASDVAVSAGGRDIPAFAEEGVTYAELPSLLEALGGWATYWDYDSQTATAQTDLFTLHVPARRSYVLADGYAYEISRGTQVWEETPYVPLRSLANLLGAEVEFVDWDTPVTVRDVQADEWSDEDLYWLSRIISAESKGENLAGQIAVGNVICNRVESEEFPDTIQEVIFDRKNGVQFEPVSNGTVYEEPGEQSILAARLALAGVDAAGDSLYFFNPSLSSGSWVRANRAYHTTIGCHMFFR